MKKTTVEVALSNEETMTVDGYEVPGADGTLVVHRFLDARGDTDGTWTVTHRASGLRVPGRFPRRRQAAAFAAELLTLPVRWAGSKCEVLADLSGEGPGLVGGAARAAGAVDAWAYLPRVERDTTRFDVVAEVEARLPAGWSLYDGDDPFGDLECPCGLRIEPDGVCPNGHEAPVLV